MSRSDTCVHRMKRDVSSWISANVPYRFANTWPQKREGKSSEFGLIKLRTIYNFCTIDKRVASVESVGIKLQETTCFQWGTRNSGVLLRRWRGTNFVFTGKKTKLETLNAN